MKNKNFKTKDNFTTGAILSPIDIRDYKGIACARSESFPEEFELSMPEVKNQGAVGSCVAHAISTVVEYHSRLYEDELRPMSVGFIYGNRTNSAYTGIGMTTRDAIQVTCEYGDVVNTLFPYNEEVPEIIEKFEAQVDSLIAKSYPNRFTEFYLLHSKDDVKASLMQNGPVIFAMRWWDDIMIDKNGYMITKCETADSSHCMVIYGWNKDGWKVQNSWGTTWGKEGRCIIPYDVKIREFWGVIDDYSENRQKQHIEELNQQVEQLNKTLEDLMNQNTQLTNSLLALEQLEDINEEQKQLIEEYTFKINQLNQSLEETQISLNNKIKEVELLQKELLEIKKPSQNKVYQFFAKVINAIVNGFIQFINWIKGAK